MTTLTLMHGAFHVASCGDWLRLELEQPRTCASSLPQCVGPVRGGRVSRGRKPRAVGPLCRLLFCLLLEEDHQESRSGRGSPCTRMAW